MSWSSRILPVAAVTAALGIAGVALGVGGGKPVDKHSAAATSSTGPNAAYSIFARPTAAADMAAWKVPASRIAEDKPDQRLDFSLAKAVRATAAKSYTAVPAAFGPCLIGNAASGVTVSCPRSEGETAALVNYAGSVGLVPDSVRQIAFTMTDGTEREVAVSDNTWSAPAEASSATFVASGRKQVVELLPRSSLPSDAQLSPDGLVTSGDVKAPLGGG